MADAPGGYDLQGCGMGSLRPFIQLTETDNVDRGCTRGGGDWGDRRGRGKEDHGGQGDGGDRESGGEGGDRESGGEGGDRESGEDGGDRESGGDRGDRESGEDGGDRESGGEGGNRELDHPGEGRRGKEEWLEVAPIEEEQNGKPDAVAVPLTLPFLPGSEPQQALCIRCH